MKLKDPIFKKGFLKMEVSLSHGPWGHRKIVRIHGVF